MIRNLALFAAFVLAAQAHAATVTITGSSSTNDTYITSSPSGSNYSSSSTLEIGGTSTTRRALISFKIFAAEGGPVPNGAVINSATLRLYKTSGPAASFEATPLARSWVPNQATYNLAATGVSWTTAGAAGVGTDIAAASVGQGSVSSSSGWLFINATANVQAFASGSANYGWRVSQVGLVGQTSFNSANGSGNRPELIVDYVSSPPSTPSGLSASVASATQVNLSWNNVSNETGYKIERKTGAGGTYAEIGTSGANVTTYPDTGVTLGNTYYYRVRATNALGDSGYSSEKSIDVAAPNAPSGLSVTLITSNRIDVAWTDASSNETGFKIERKTEQGGTYSQIATTAANSTSYSDMGLAADTTYYYRVRASNGALDSAYSNEASARTSGAAAVPTSTVDYVYDTFGNLISTNAGGVVTTLSYDLRGRKTGMSDPDMGAWTYTYNALGELISQTDAKSQVTTMEYDLLGRMIKRIEADLTSRWTYDAYPTAVIDPNWDDGLLTGLSGSCAKGVGKLCFASAGNDYKRLHTYDSLGRPQELKVGVDASYVVTTAYAASGADLGKVSTLTYPTGFAVKNVYNATGYLAEVRDNADSALFWQANAQNAAGNVTGETLGNGLTVARSYDTLFRLTAASATNGAVTPHSQTFAYDAIGNLDSRSDVTQGVTENFYYDSLNRLLVSSGPGLVSRFYDYDALGNITYKSDVGAYTYPGTGSARPHAVSGVGNSGVSNSVTASYTYDANGSLTGASGTIYPASGSVSFSRTLTYMSFNMPNVLTHVQGGATYSYTYTYSAEHERVRLVTERPSDTLTSIYIHPAGKGALLYEKETRQSDGLVEHKHYVNGGAGLIGVYVTKSSYGSGEAPGMRYYHKDHLGSIAVITNPAGAVLERLAYEAFGERRYPSGAPEDRTAALIGVTTDRGFTAHEHLDEMMLIHMNGRIYDPVLGRFMTADPILQAPYDLQSYNRYSYGFNRPLAGTDPSGHDFFLAFLIFAFGAGADMAGYHTAGKVLMSVGAGYFFGPALGLAGGSAIGNGIIGGFAAGLIGSGGNLEAGIQGALLGGLFGAVGANTNAGSFESYAGHAAAGCLSGAVSGGGCARGAISQLVSKGATNLSVAAEWGNGAQFVAATVAGGTASAIGGGRFVNGAVTGAFGYLFNQAATAGRAAAMGAGVRGCSTCSASQSSSSDDLTGAGSLPRDREAAQAQRDALTTDQAKSGQLVYRVWGGASPEMGPSWTPLDPQIAGGDYRNLAGLPNGNAGTNITIGRLIDTTGIMVIPATPLHGNAGGWPEYRLTRPPAIQIQVLERYGVAPPY